MKTSKLRHAPVIGFTGCICAGKDYVASLAGLERASMAEPLYKLSELFWDLGASARGQKPDGLREFWQKVGQWGKGIISAQYPLTPERAAFEEHVRNTAAASLLRRFGSDYAVDWSSYGRNPAIWANALIERLSLRCTPGKRHGVTNLRFPVEINPFVKNDWPVVHVTASPATLRQRQMNQGVRPEAAEDISEEYATRLDSLIADICGRSYATPSVIDWLEANGYPHCAVVWNDLDMEPPAEGMITPEAFVRLL